MLLRELLDSFNEDLNDLNPAGTLPNRWSQAQLLRFFNEGLCHVFSLKPTEFVEQVIVELEPGNVQKLCDCKILHKLLGQTDETGLVVSPLNVQDQGLVARWTKAPCPSPISAEFKLTGYTYDAGDNGYFSVYPAVPPNEKVYLKALCANPPEPLTMVDLNKEVDADCMATNAARQWVMYSALMVDDESQTGLAAARIHLEAFFQVLQIQMTTQRLAEMGVSGGARGNRNS